MSELQVSPERSLRGGPRAARRAVAQLIRLGKSAQVSKIETDFCITGLTRAFLNGRSHCTTYNKIEKGAAQFTDVVSMQI